MRLPLPVRALAAAALCAVSWSQAKAGEAKLAVAANFTEPVREIGKGFERTTGHRLVLSLSASGQFYAQITQGAPFDILLSADQATPAKAIAEGHAVGGTAFTYAVGRLVLFSKTAGLVEGEKTLKEGKFAKVAIANPATAPYGAAAVAAMKALGVYAALQPKIVQGNSIAQTFQFVDTGNAEVGFVALSQVALVEGGSRWTVPQSLYAAIAQDAVLLKPGAGNDAARAFLAYLKGPEARRVIVRFGYGLAD
ncbi:MAG: molybdate ABC transporter substrate-binding protein [Hyphomicrobiaceae bacterium]|nr:molybdate ABC transporter substrate-binding protein [Hyphomicrobiaceae bacterium]